jgi:hypothetical protein
MQLQLERPELLITGGDATRRGIEHSFGVSSALIRNLAIWARWKLLFLRPLVTDFIFCA